METTSPNVATISRRLEIISRSIASTSHAIETTSLTIARNHLHLANNSVVNATKIIYYEFGKQVIEKIVREIESQTIQHLPITTHESPLTNKEHRTSFYKPDSV